MRHPAHLKLLFIAVLILSVFQFAAPIMCPSVGVSIVDYVVSAQEPMATSAQIGMSLSTTDSNGNPKSVFSRGEFVLVMITVNNVGTDSLSNIHILLTIYDPNNAPIFFGISITSLSAGAQQSQLIGAPIGLNLPTGAFRGEVIILTDFLASGGRYIPDGAGTIAFTVT